MTYITWKESQTNSSLFEKTFYLQKWKYRRVKRGSLSIYYVTLYVNPTINMYVKFRSDVNILMDLFIENSIKSNKIGFYQRWTFNRGWLPKIFVYNPLIDGATVA